MTNINSQQVDLVFEYLKSNLLAAPLVVSHLEKIKPKQHETDTHEWRYRLKGFVEGIVSVKLLSIEIIEQLNDTLFGDQKRKSQRPDKTIKYSVDILNDQGKTFVFDVPSINPLDAYFQLTKRTAYKVIPDISSVLIYTGFFSERLSGIKPVRIFNRDELVFVSLL